ncbi:MAG TPA: hypothetical protein VIJ65_10580 [Acidobacteriaceae bacterium]
MRSRTGTALLITLFTFICCGADSGGCNTSQERIGPSGAEVGAAIAGVAVVIVGAVVLIEVNHSHHTLKGCVLSGPSGLELRTDDQKSYVLTGTTANIKAGDQVGLHGSRVKHSKGSPGDPTFIVEKMKKNYGPCKAFATPPPSATP